MGRCYCLKSVKTICTLILRLALIYHTQWQWLDYIMSVYRFTMCYNHSLTLCSHAVIVSPRCRIPNLYLIMCTYYPMVLLFYLVGCTFHFVLLKRHLKAVFHSILISVQILFIRILFIRIFFIHILFIRYFLFVHFSFIYFSFAYFSSVYFSVVYFSSYTFHSSEAATRCVL